MKQRNGYYHAVFGRPAGIKLMLLNFFISFSYLFRVPIENIIRTDMGERYYNTFLSVCIALFFILVPIPLCRFNVPYFDWSRLFSVYGTWYLYTGWYVWCSIKRWKEVHNNPSVWDFKKFSLSTGKPHHLLKTVKIKGEVITSRTLTTIVEPGIVFIVGVLLTLLLQPIGLILILCAIIYSLGYVGAFYNSDLFIMDKIDEMICNEDLHDILVEDKPSARGFEFYAKRPTDKEARERLYDDIVDAEIIDDDEPPVVN